MAASPVFAVHVASYGAACAGAFNPNLSCTSNDIKINDISQLGTGVTSCIENQEITIDIALTTQLNANERYDPLFWIGEQGQNPRGTSGTCYVSSLPGDPEVPEILDLEGGADVCLDVNSAAVPVVQHFHDVTFTCVDNVSPAEPFDPKHPDAVVQVPDGKADVFALVTWFQNNSLQCGLDTTLPAGSFEPGVNPKCDASLLLDLDIVIVPDTTLKLVKTVVNDNGGTAIENDFQAKIDGEAVIWGAPNVLDPGLHTASEDSVVGYASGDWGGDCNADGTITLVEGNDHVCTITNDDIAPTLELQKEVITDNGGSAVEGDFQARIDTVPVAWDTPVVLSAGNHIASEDVHDGYVASAWAGDCNADGSIVLSPGQTAVCTITNDDAAPGLTLQKIIINDDGGTAVATDFEVKIDDVVVIWDEVNDLTSGVEYVVSESPADGYAASGWSGDCAADGTITLTEGQAAVCTITNDDIAPTLTLAKTVVNDFGGTALITDFQASIDTTDVDWGVATELDAGAYVASESSLVGYTEGDWGGDCNPDGSITLSLAQEATCTITNSDVQPLLTVSKVVINNDGGLLQVDDFPLFVNASLVTSGSQLGYDAGEYVVSETSDAGYVASFSGDCDVDGNIVLAIGDVKVCTITNDDIALDQPIPAVSNWALLLLSFVLLMTGWYFHPLLTRKL